MKIKLDENLSKHLKTIFKEDAHEVDTVEEENLTGQPDEVIYATCRREQKVLITLDHDFGNILRFPLNQMEGIVLLEPPNPHLDEDIIRLSRIVSKELKTRPIREILWIVQPDRIRVRPLMKLCE